MTPKGRFLACLLGLLALRLLLMAFVPVFDTSESRYAAISANMARTGDFVVPHFTYEGHYQSFDGKPPLVFQAGGVMCKILGTENPVALQFAVRVCPLASALLLLVILFHGVKKIAAADAARSAIAPYHGGADPGDPAWLAVAICATATAFFAAAGICMTDMTLTCCVAGALILYRSFAEAKELRYAFGVMALMGAGMIVKGPVALVLFGLPVFVDAIVNKRWRTVFAGQWLVAAPVFFLIAVPWFVLVEGRNPGAVLYFFYNENFLRFVKHDYGDKYGAGREAFRGVAILWALAATLPWSLVPVWRLVDAVSHRVRKGGVGFLLTRRDSASTMTRTDFASTVTRTDFASTVPRRGSASTRVGVSLVSGLASHALDFFTLSALVITLFWCLTSRVLLYYLFPMIPLFAAALALRGDRRRLARLVPWVAGFSALVLAVALVWGTLSSRKMMGAKAPNTYGYDGYAHEFYHGTNPRCLTEKGVSLEDSLRDRYLKTPEGRNWIETPQGRAWAKLPGVRQWMKDWGYAK